MDATAKTKTARCQCCATTSRPVFRPAEQERMCLHVYCDACLRMYGWRRGVSK